MKKILVLQHAPPETLGTIADPLLDQSVAAHYVRPFQDDPVPGNMDQADGLIVMGGPMGVYDQDRLTFLKDECRLIEKALKANKPVLGVCLGSQLLASVLGAEVARGRHFELGWHLVLLNEAGQADSLWSGIERNFFAMHWHRDYFNLPQGAVNLASSEMTTHQAFRYGNNAYGLLFHLETTEYILREMIRTFSEDLTDEKIDETKLMHSGQEHFAPLERISNTFFGRWASLL